MADTPPFIRMTVHSDPRLVPGVGAAVEMCAQRGGLDSKASADLRLAAEAVVRDTFDLAGDADCPVEMRLEGFADRVEVALEHRGEALPTAGLDTFLNAGAQDASANAATGIALIARVDRVLYHTENGLSRTTLIKYRKKT